MRLLACFCEDEGLASRELVGGAASLSRKCCFASVTRSCLLFSIRVAKRLILTG